MSDPLELELEALVSYPIWVPGAGPTLSATAASALASEPSLQPLQWILESGRQCLCLQSHVLPMQF